MTETLYVKREGEFSYPIYFRQDFGDLYSVMKDAGYENRHICIVTDDNVAPLYLESVKESLSLLTEKLSFFVMEAGEENKNLQTVSKVYRHLIETGMDRKGVLVALGGGVVGDLTGFSAATYLRGVDFVQIPTTLLSQVDSSVGGKTGVDMDQYKNMVGAFHQPQLVYMNFKTLETLPEEEFVCGMGEVIKTGLICDASFFRTTVESYDKIQAFDEKLLPETVRRCCEIKAGIVERDPREQGERALLNLGHTVGHAVEKLMNFKLHHGQCVGVGLVAAAEISLQRGLLSQEEKEEILHGCQVCGLPLFVHGLKAEDVLAATRKDKKMDQGRVRFVLMKGIGSTYVDHSLSEAELLSGIQEILR